MSDFAKSQLLKYGWTEGKGLGKNENGIAEALKPKLKFDTTGIGHKDLEFQWWDSIYDKALKNIVLDKKSDEVSINLAKKNAFNISSTKSGSEVSNKKYSLRYGKFLKTSTLQDGNIIRDSTCEVIEDDTKDNPIVVKMSDEELFRACGGRTAHKGARHGLTLNGKLARIAEQEKKLIAAQFLKTSNDSSQYSDVKVKKHKKKKKFMKTEDCTSLLKDEYISSNEDSYLILPESTQSEDDKPPKKTCKKVIRKINDLTHQLTKSCMIQDDTNKNNEENQKIKSKDKKKKCKRKLNQDIIDNNVSGIQLINDLPMEPSTKKTKTNNLDLSESVTAKKRNDELLDCVIDKNIETAKCNSKHKKDKSHRSTKSHKYNYCTNTEAERLNEKIRLKKSKKFARKESKKLQELSESLLAVSLNVNSAEKNSKDSKKKKKKYSKIHKKNKNN